MDENSLFVLAIAAVFISLASLCVAFALLDKLQRVDNMALENRSSINRHTGRLHKLDNSMTRVDRSINDIYETVGEQENMMRRYFMEVEQHEGDDEA